jgi:hypothetical protein
MTNDDTTNEEPKGLFTRRQALVTGAMAAAASRLRADASASGVAEDALDEALQRIHAEEPRVRGGLSSHAPMVVEAITALGLAEQVLPWLQKFNSARIELPAAHEPIDAKNWRAALGPKRDERNWEAANHRFGDWCTFFAAQLAEQQWSAVLDTWAARLAPGLSGAATHGIIRTAHAVRALGRKETPVRLAELARGLAYWASSYEELPAHKADKTAADFAAALATLPMFCKERGRAPAGPDIVAALRQTAELEGFAAARDLVAPADDVGVALTALTTTFAGVYLRSGTQHNTIGFVHAITAPCALRKLAPHLATATAKAALPYAWQAAAAIHCAFSRPDDDGKAPATSLTAGAVAARAVDNGAEHAIKLTEALLAEHAVAEAPVYLAAATDVVSRL